MNYYKKTIKTTQNVYQKYKKIKKITLTVKVRDHWILSFKDVRWEIILDKMEFKEENY